MEYSYIFSTALIVALITIFVYVIKIYLEFKDSQISKIVPSNKFGKYDLSGKVIILTGATDGIGKEMARFLSSFNPKRLIIPARNKQKGTNLLNYIKKQNGSSDNVEIWDTDLADLQSVVNFTDKFIREVGELHMLFNNADITSSSAHPGLMNTQLLKSNDLTGDLIVRFVKYHTESWEQGAVNILYPVLCSNINDNGKYFDKCAEREPNKVALDEELRKKLWDFSVDILKEKGYF
ncbi:12925_t:CDS:2 [Rhizophagus irregularis]|nr:12925_t:CDS:2 [Rhizophagus irregularis]